MFLCGLRSLRVLAAAVILNSQLDRNHVASVACIKIVLSRLERRAFCTAVNALPVQDNNNIDWRVARLTAYKSADNTYYNRLWLQLPLLTVHSSQSGACLRLSVPDWPENGNNCWTRRPGPSKPCSKNVKHQLLIVNRISIFFHWQILLQFNCNKVNKDSTAPHMRCYTAL